jgi:hypothetical protein
MSTHTESGSPVSIQTSPQSVSSTPQWFGEVLSVIAHDLRRLGMLLDITERVRFARRRFGHYDLIDFAVVLLGYALSGERTLSQAPVEILRAVFLEDLLARPLEKEEKTGGLWDRQGMKWVVFDVDGTRQAARQRALPSTPDLPPAQRRLDKVCAPGYTGRKRGETVRTRTTVRKNHTHQWVGTFAGASGAGNGD